MAGNRMPTVLSFVFTFQDKYSVEEVEESVPTYPIFQVKAIDPDIGNPSVEQNITYYLDSKSQVSRPTCPSQYF